MRDSPTSARPFVLFELERCINRMEKVNVCELSLSIRVLFFEIGNVYVCMYSLRVTHYV